MGHVAGSAHKNKDCLSLRSRPKIVCRWHSSVWARISRLLLTYSICVGDVWVRRSRYPTDINHEWDSTGINWIQTKRKYWLYDAYGRSTSVSVTSSSVFRLLLTDGCSVSPVLSARRLHIILYRLQRLVDADPCDALDSDLCHFRSVVQC